MEYLAAALVVIFGAVWVADAIQRHRTFIAAGEDGVRWRGGGARWEEIAHYSLVDMGHGGQRLRLHMRDGTVLDPPAPGGEKLEAALASPHWIAVRG